MNKHVLECICTHRTAPFQLRFSRQAMRFLSRRPDYSVKVSRRGLIVSGETEASVASVVKVLRIVYDQDLCVGQLTIRHRHGTIVEEPHMGVRVLCPADYFSSVKADLLSRGAQISDAELMPQIGVLRATASLAKLLGYSQQLAALTDGKAHEVIWLSHYAPLQSSALAHRQNESAWNPPIYRGLFAPQE
jgi:predicted membrane GTPase involved in stress response